MKSIFYIAVIVAVVFAGCIGTKQSGAVDTKTSYASPPPASPNDQETTAPAPPSAAKKERDWTPKFIPTGFASGIMVEFTGMKKDATLHARYASIELHPVAGDRNPDAARPLLDLPYILTSTINDLRQSFFKVAPGKYRIRQVKDWAEQSIVANVEVQEGSYSVVQFEVINPRTPIKSTTELEPGNMK
jgi:hypothetical protein